jgi:hypothetical protein
LKLFLIKNSDRKRFSMRKTPLPARKKAFHRGNTIRETADAIAISAMTAHNIIRIVFFFDIAAIEIAKVIKFYS